jgi:glutamate transport system substrate-binding protein
VSEVADVRGGTPAEVEKPDLPADSAWDAVTEGADPPPPAEPPPDEPSSLVTLAPVRLATLGVALVLVVAITFVKLFHTGPPSVDDLRSQAGVDAWSELAIGVKDDQPGVAFHDRRTGIWSGFDIDIAYMIAEDLGFRRGDVKFYAIESEDRARMQATDAGGHRIPVQMVIASYSITAAREAMTGVTFSAPYLYTEQSVVTLAGHRKVSTLVDMRGRTVCTLSTSTSETAPEAAGANVIRRNKVSECFAELRAHHVDAVTTDAAILAGYEAEDPKGLAHWDLGLDVTEAWGVNVGENTALRDLVNVTLYRSLRDPKDHRWEDAFDANLQVEAPASGRTPIAVAQQPDVPKPDVRQLPWDGSYP